MRHEELTVNELTVNRIIGNGVNPEYNGDIFHLVKEKAATDAYYLMLKKKGISDSRIFATLATAYAAITDKRGDNLVIWPGDHIQTASLTWAKSACRIINPVSLNQSYQPSTMTSGGTRLSCVTTGIAEIINFTGHYISMAGIGTFNSYNNAGNIADIKITGKNFHAYRCSFRGGQGAAQIGADGIGVPLLFATDVAGGANAAFIEDCTIGSSGNTTRTHGPGCCIFPGGAAAGFGIKFKGCRFSTRIETATNNNVGLIKLTADYAVDRELLFEDCVFYNFTENLGTGPTYVFRDACTTTHQIILKNCVANKGFTSWTDRATNLSSSNPVPHLTGGIGVNS